MSNDAQADYDEIKATWRDEDATVVKLSTARELRQDLTPDLPEALSADITNLAAQIETAIRLEELALPQTD